MLKYEYVKALNLRRLFELWEILAIGLLLNMVMF